MRILSEYEAAAKSEQYDAFWTDARRSLEDVFSRWCTPKERRHGRLGSFANPPEYQPSHEQILETVNETPRRIIVLTRRIIGFKDARKYVLLKKGDRWWIDNVKWQSKDGDWQNGIL
jgi:hypothetical protein